MRNLFRLILILLSLTRVTVVFSQPSGQPHSIEVNGIRLYYETFGQGKPLLLLHGWTQTGSFWKPYIDEYAKSYEVYVVDLRGHGKSSPLAKDFSIQRAAADLRGMIQKLNLAPVRIIGLSYGGLLALEVAASEGSMIDRMVLIGTSNRYIGKESLKDKPPFRYEQLEVSFKNYLKEQHPQGEEQIRALFNPNLDYQINIPAPVLEKIPTKVLIVNGDSDEIVGLNGAIEMHRHLPNSALWVIPQAGHLALSTDNQQEFIRLTKSFLSR
ncbi:alpha/beta fold hydrolase [Larkinella soli]|uniref:alpha/beta fold hydrolase n=1 Tax=Larkinella soli TaxID=1770527 RepID=UPI000FFC6BF7|nr:alpha/beta hydrolase [Larkinella soli]